MNGTINTNNNKARFIDCPYYEELREYKMRREKDQLWIPVYETEI